MAFKITGEQPTVRINWGDGTINTYYGQEIITNHVYPKDESILFIIEAEILSGQIDYCDSTGGDCSPERIAELAERFTAIVKPYNFSPGHWISIKFNGDVLDDMLLNLVKDSYNLVISKC